MAIRRVLQDKVRDPLHKSPDPQCSAPTVLLPAKLYAQSTVDTALEIFRQVTGWRFAPIPVLPTIRDLFVLNSDHPARTQTRGGGAEAPPGPLGCD